MTSSLPSSQAADDAQLVERSLQGDTAAFGRLVERHQAAVCGLAYSMCGSVHASEDLAQETFIAAWRQLRTLREKSNVRGWLCGIARNLAGGFLRRQQRTPTARAASLDQAADTCCPTPAPDESAMQAQEAALLWHTLQRLPGQYREPMVLYYRQQESVRAVAESLGLSEEAVKQRLSRGRALLAGHVERLLGDTLRQTAPTLAFTACVLAALPLATTTASAATAGAALAQGTTGAGFKAVSLTALKMLLGPVLALLGAAVGYRVSMDSARSLPEQKLVKKFYRALGVWGAGLGMALLALALSGGWLSRHHPQVFAGLLVAMTLLSLLLGLGAIIWAARHGRSLPQHEAGGDSGAALPLGRWGVPLLEYRSRLSLLGLPLVHLRFGRKKGAPVRPVKAWFAAGDFAIGVVAAFGAAAVAPLSIGGCALGLLSFGGFAAGIACWGGIGVGVWAIGGFAVGWMAYGGLALGWQAAEGGLAAARELALGEGAVAAHANDALAKAALRQTTFFPIARGAMDYAVWINLIWLLPLVLMWWKARRVKQRAGGAPAST